MITQIITNADQFRDTMNQGRAIVFIDFEWSDQAMLSRQVLQEWMRLWDVWNPDIDVTIYELDGDLLTEAHEWLKEIGEVAGYGSLNWLENGHLKRRIPYVVGAGIEKIAKITKELWDCKD